MNQRTSWREWSAKFHHGFTCWIQANVLHLKVGSDEPITIEASALDGSKIGWRWIVARCLRMRR